MLLILAVILQHTHWESVVVPQVVAVALVLLVAKSSEAQQPQEQLESAIDPAQVAPEVKPHVAILKQINQINKDGSYVF